ncbi:sugar porter (SP) family MFS transporter [Rhizoctonia solani 123E]|uniref:Sugar porter (SP) family MFS transporter n=1 Tax=Rhizoctonia solani 123E TaxID=1423351 RepID=A0A074RR41_9AGAM|nr:sugar porter (SP) family MFS transporter [Rhizoctonia solani 123E]
MSDREMADAKVHTTHEKPLSLFQDILKHRKAYWMATSACWGGMLFGWDTGLIGGVLPRQSFKHSFGLDTPAMAKDYANLQGWIVTVLQAGCFFGAMSAAFVSDRFGRKVALFAAAFFFFLGSILQTVPALGSQSARSSLNQLYVGRAIGGFGVGLVSVTVPTYISESAPRLIRGRLTGMYQLAIVFGIAFSFWTNYGLLQQYGESPNVPQQWRIAFALQMLPGVLLVASMLTQSESPRWLAEKGRDEECKRVLARLRGVNVHDPVVEEEYALIKADFEGRVKLSLGEQFREATSSRKMLYRCSLPFILMAFQQWTGVNSMNYYSPKIFESLGMKGSSANLLGTGIYGIVKIVMTALVLGLGVEQLGRKSLLIWGGLGQVLCMCFIGAYLKIHTDGSVIPTSYVAIVAIYLYVTFYSFGWSVAPWPVMSESQPNHLRSLTMSIGLMSNWLFNFTISKITPILLEKITYGTYLLFAGTTSLGILWTIFFLPETGGYSLEEIGDLFQGSLVTRSLSDNKFAFKRMREEDRDQIRQGLRRYGSSTGSGWTDEKPIDERYERSQQVNVMPAVPEERR